MSNFAELAVREVEKGVGLAGRLAARGAGDEELAAAFSTWVVGCGSGRGLAGRGLWGGRVRVTGWVAGCEGMVRVGMIGSACEGWGLRVGSGAACAHGVQPAAVPVICFPLQVRA